MNHSNSKLVEIKSIKPKFGLNCHNNLKRVFIQVNLKIIGTKYYFPGDQEFNLLASPAFHSSMNLRITSHLPISFCHNHASYFKNINPHKWYHSAI
jgi:hypothetical protein